MEILSMAADYCPVLLPIVHCLNFPSTVTDAIFCEKLERLMNKQSADLSSWLKIAWNFEKDEESYASNVRKLIYLLNAMNEDNLIDVYANLLHAYQLGLLNRDDFFRLSWILTQVYYDDLLLLKEIGPEFCDTNWSRLSSIQPYGLVRTHTTHYYDGREEMTYTLTQLGRNMLECGLELDDYPANQSMDINSKGTREN